MKPALVLLGTLSLVILFILVTPRATSQETKNDNLKPTAPKAEPAKAQVPKKKTPPKPAGTPIPLVGDLVSISSENQVDLPSLTRAPDGAVFAAYLEWDGIDDTLVLARESSSGFESVALLAEDKVLHPPTMTVDRTGIVWCIWGETNLDDDTVDLKARSWFNGNLGETVTLADTDASEAFPDAGTDSQGNVWVTWQSFRAGEGDIYARRVDAGSLNWSSEIAVAVTKGGDWAPKISFDQEGSAWIAYDSSRDNEFDLYLKHLNPDGSGEEFPIAHSDRYEARASITTTADGSGFWIAAERGKIRWGLDSRGHDNATGINAGKEVLFGRFDLESKTFTELPLGLAGKLGNPVNLPIVGVGQDGNPWVSYRYFDRVLWRIGVTNYRIEEEIWSSRRRIEGSSYGQDRSVIFLPAASAEADIRIAWPSDLRTTKEQGKSSVYIASLPSASTLPESAPPESVKRAEDFPYPPSQDTPERPADDRHTWTHEGTTYGLYWGDLHRHTDVSNCRTGFDGSIVEHFRYAYDIAKLDFLGTSDHTDAGKPYDPYEWWHNQRLHDALHSPQRFNTLYVYEREQKWPWGHRNIVFADRGAPVVYIQRNRYRESPWQSVFPVKPGLQEISPMELWDILRRYEKPVAVISHTGASRMGTDWGKYDRIDYSSESVVEILQGARVSYEGNGAPQPTVGLMPGEDYTINGDPDVSANAPNPIPDFGIFKAGTYQNALEMGWKLGVFASSDHISQHASYGGVFCEEFTREAIIEGFDARRTVAATDKIYLDFTCNGNPLGSIFTTDTAPRLVVRVDGTATLKRITIVRNEEDWRIFDQIQDHRAHITLTDDEMEEGENRYYVRVEQADGNMAWSSPVWVTPSK